MDWNDIRQTITDFGVDTFGQSVTFLPKAGGAVQIKGVFTREWMEIKSGNSLPISGVMSVLDINLAQLPAKPTSGDKVSVNSIEFRIIDCQEDGGGGARLVLQK